MYDVWEKVKTGLSYHQRGMFAGGWGGGALPDKLGGGVLPTSQDPYHIYDQKLRFLRPGQKFDGLFMTVAAGTVT